jgi:hypothetical protein
MDILTPQPFDASTRLLCSVNLVQGLIGSGQGSINSGSSAPTLPPWLQQILQNTGGQQLTAQQTLPQLSTLPGMTPELNVPNLTPQEQALIGNIGGQAGSGLDPAYKQLSELTSGPIGSSPATAAGMEAFQQQIAPQIMQQEALAGRGTGGGATEAIGQGATAAALPLIQQEIGNREAAVGQYANLDQTQMQGYEQALTAAGLPREIATAQSQAQYQQLLQQLAMIQGIQTGPENLFGNTIGQTGSSSSHPTSYWF